MSAPAERLLAAADLLDKRAGEATEGPWSVMHGTDVVRRLPGELTYKGIATRDACWPEDATYIATMHPEVGKALATALRVEGGTVAGWAPETAESHAALLLPIADLLLAGEA